MRVIAHRANINGPCADTENTMLACYEAFLQGYEVELDIRYDAGNILIGHDDVKEKVLCAAFVTWVGINSDNLWLHCKDVESLQFCIDNHLQCNYFGHSNDEFVLTSRRFIFSAPGVKATTRTVCVMPELSTKSLNFAEYYAVLTDFPAKYKNI